MTGVLFVSDVDVTSANTPIPSAPIQAQLPGKDCDNKIYISSSSSILF